MNNCNFCERNTGFRCGDCLLLEAIPSQKLLAELIRRELVLVQHSLTAGKQKIEGYFIWKQKLEKYDQNHEKQ